MTTNWKYSPYNDGVVFRVLDSGKVETRFADAKFLKKNTPEPADLPLALSVEETQKVAEIAAGVTDAAWLEALIEQAVSGKTDKINVLKTKLQELDIEKVKSK